MTAEVPGRQRGQHRPEHPWLGLSSYTEETRAYFHGRDDEAAELARRVQRKEPHGAVRPVGTREDVVAARRPRAAVRGEGYCPCTCGWTIRPESPRPPSRSSKASQGHGGRRALDAPWHGDRGESLWEFLHHRGDLLRDASGRTLLPLLIFDQFEEIFTLAQADDRGRLRAREFVEELADLVENRPPLALERRLEHDDTAADDFDFARADYRILIALREDTSRTSRTSRARCPRSRRTACAWRA